MLDFLRKRKRSWVVTFLLGLVVVVFVLFYGGRYVREPGTEKVAEINGEVISQREFGIHYQKLVDVYRDLFKGALTQEALKDLKLKSTVMEQVIQRHLLLQETRRLGLEVADDELMDAIARMPEFQVDGRFSKNRYLQILRANRLNPGQFEEERREHLSVQKLSDMIQDSVHVSENEAREQYRFAQERVAFYFIRLSAGDSLSQTSVTEDEIKNYYDRSKDALTEPVKVQVEYIVYPFDQFSSKIQVGEKEIEDYYKINRATKFQQARAIRLRHILLRVPSGAGTEQKAGARAKAEAALQESRGGKDFAELVKKYSEEPSAAQGGEIGWISEGQLLPSLDQAAFALKKGEVSNILESPLGYHILKAEEVREQKSTGLKEATPEIIRAIRAERGKSETGRAVDADREKAIAGTDLTSLAKQRGLAAKATPLFGPFEVLPEVGPMAEFRRAAFSLAAKEVSSVIEGSGGYYLLRVRQRKEPALPPLESVRSEIERRLKEGKALELATKKAQALLDQMKKEKEIEKVAKANGLQVGETGWFLRSDAEIPKVGALQEIRPGGIAISTHQPVADRFYTQKNGIFLFAFKASQGADMERFEREKASLLEQVLAEKKQRVMKNFIDNLKAKARVEVESKFLEES